jgi:DNA-binding HxlR family transcriptional regulator
MIGENAMRYSEQLCIRFQQAMEILGKRWTGLIIKLLLERPLRFHELAEQLEVIGDRMLSQRLKELEHEGVLERRIFAEVPTRVEYSLTDKGRALAPVVASIEAWSDRWIEHQPVALQNGERS